MQTLKIYMCLVLSVGLYTGCKEEEDSGFNPPEVVEETGAVPEVVQWLTQANETSLFEIKTGDIKVYDEDLSEEITVSVSTEFQEIVGFGFALTGGSAEHIAGMSSQAQDDLINELFGTAEGEIGMSFIRISVGASDLDSHVFSYNDQPVGNTDIDQNDFSIAPDQVHLIPVLKKILAVNPNIRIMASPWSPPAWMKSNNSPKGGRLRAEYYDSYALYLMKYLQAMAEEGIDVQYLSIQNEPLHDGNNPSMFMPAEEQVTFIKSHLGPLFATNTIDVAIIAYDHNPDRVDYPIAVLNDDEARQYIDGSAFHLYAGNIEALSTVHGQHPDKNIYFTEQWFGAPGNFSEDLKWHTREVVIGSMRNWSKSVIEWNLSSNASLSPHTDGGCSQCLGGVTIEGDIVKRNAGYYVIAHASRYVLPGSKRVFSTLTGDLPNVAFITPDQKVVLLVLNNSDQRKEFNVNQSNVRYATVLDPGSVSTYVWSLN